MSTAVKAALVGGVALLGVGLLLDYKRRNAPDYHEQVVQSALPTAARCRPHVVLFGDAGVFFY